MSRGLGRVELDVLTILEAGELLSSAEVATRVFGCPVPSAAEYSSVCRALASLARKGLADADGTRAWGSLKAVQSQRRKKLRLQSTPFPAKIAASTPISPRRLSRCMRCSSLERQHLPQHIWEPAAGAGAIVDVLRGAGYTVVASDIADYGLVGCKLIDYLAAVPPPDVGAIVTNPPFAKAETFARKMLSEVPYVALLLRTNFLESAEREPFFAEHPFARMWVPSPAPANDAPARLDRTASTEQYRACLVCLAPQRHPEKHCRAFQLEKAGFRLAEGGCRFGVARCDISHFTR